MKICLISPYPPEINGLAEYAELTVKEMLSLNHKLEIHVISNRITTSWQANEFAPRVFVHRVWDRFRPLTPLRTCVRILRIRPQLVHIQYGLANDYGGIAGEPLIPLILFLRLARVPVVTTLHSIWSLGDLKTRAIERGHPRMASFLRNYVSVFMHVIFRFSRAVIILVLDNKRVSPYLARDMGLPRRKMTEIYHGCPDPEEYGGFRQTKDSRSTPQELLFFGFLRRNKGVHTALEAFRLITLTRPDIDLRMTVAGPAVTQEDYIYLIELRKLVSKLGIAERVSFRIGFLSRNEIGRLFSNAALLILPYNRRVGPSGPLCLAAAFGLPVVASRDDKYLSRDLGGFVRLVRSDDCSDLERAILETVSDLQRSQQMSDRARAYAQLHPLRVSAEAVLREYLNVLG